MALGIPAARLDGGAWCRGPCTRTHIHTRTHTHTHMYTHTHEHKHTHTHTNHPASDQGHTPKLKANQRRMKRINGMHSNCTGRNLHAHTHAQTHTHKHTHTHTCTHTNIHTHPLKYTHTHTLTYTHTHTPRGCPWLCRESGPRTTSASARAAQCSCELPAAKARRAAPAGRAPHPRIHTHR